MLEMILQSIAPCSSCIELNDLIEEIAPEVKRQQTWQERQENQQESWECFRPRIFEELLMFSSLPPDMVIKPVYVAHVQCWEICIGLNNVVHSMVVI